MDGGLVQLLVYSNKPVWNIFKRHRWVKTTVENQITKNSLKTNSQIENTQNTEKEKLQFTDENKCYFPATTTQPPHPAIATSLQRLEWLHPDNCPENYWGERNRCRFFKSKSNPNISF